MPAVSKPDRTRFKTYIRLWREFKKLTQDQVALRMGTSRENYGRIENGKVPYNQDTLEMIAHAIGCKPADLLERDPFIEHQVDELRALLDKAPHAEKRRVLAAAKSYLENN